MHHSLRDFGSEDINENHTVGGGHHISLHSLRNFVGVFCHRHVERSAKHGDLGHA
jgi:hypothetical protein